MDISYEQVLGLARDDDVKSIKKLLEIKCPPTYSNKIGQTALHIGAMWGSFDVLKVLLEAQANPNQQNSIRGSTPLHAAAMGSGPVDKRAECIRFLIAKKADPNLKDKSGEVPIVFCDDEILRTALGAQPLVLHNAVKAKKVEGLEGAISQVLKNDGPQGLNKANKDGESPLVFAIVNSWREGAQLLVQARADVCACDNYDQTPLHKAILSGDHLAVAFLMQARADANARDIDQEHFLNTQERCTYRTPLHYAAERGNVLSLRSLLSEGASEVNATDSQLQTPLHLALEFRLQGGQLCWGVGVRVSGLQKRPDMNGRLGAVIGNAVTSSPSGYTDSLSQEAKAAAVMRWPVLIDGSAEGVLLKADNLQMLSDEALDLLLDSRADVGIGNKVCGETQTVLHLVAQRGEADLTKRILAKGADIVNKQDNSGFSALHLAVCGRHKEVVILLLEARADCDLRTTGDQTAEDLARTTGADAVMLALLGAFDDKFVSAASELG